MSCVELRVRAHKNGVLLILLHFKNSLSYKFISNGFVALQNGTIRP